MRINRKAAAWLFLAVLILLMPFAACEGDSRVFTDDAGRKVPLPTEITRVAVSGPLAEIAVFALAPDRLAAVPVEWTDLSRRLVPEKYWKLPVLGQLYGGRAEMNLESLLALAPQVVIDVGQGKKTIVEDLDGLQAQTGIPFAHIDAGISSMGAAFIRLGELLGLSEEAEQLRAYYEDVWTRVTGIADGAEKAHVLYLSGARGLNVLGKGSFHAEIIDRLAENLAELDAPVNSGAGNETDMEQLMAWDPDVLLFAPDSVFDSVGEDPLWTQMKAVADGRYFRVPQDPYNGSGFPSAVQRPFGMLWMVKTLYPDAADYDLFEEARNYIRLYLHGELTEEIYREFLGE